MQSPLRSLQGRVPTVSAEEKLASADAEQSRTAGLMALMKAEHAVIDARFSELAAAGTAAWRRHAAAKGRVTRALKDGHAARIAAAQRREIEAYREACRIADECLQEMFALNQARLGNVGVLLEQMTRSWAAGAAALRAIQEPGNQEEDHHELPD